MVKHLNGHAKKILMIISIGVLVAGGSYGAYMWHQKPQPLQVPVSEQAKKQAQSYNISGDNDIAARYVDLMNAGKAADAQRVFDERVKQEADVQKKADLYAQNVNLALSLEKTDAALEAANRLVATRQTHDSYAQLANVHIARSETAQQVVSLQKAIDALKAAKDVPNKDELMVLYQSQLDAANEWEALKKQNGW